MLGVSCESAIDDGVGEVGARLFEKSLSAELSKRPYLGKLNPKTYDPKQEPGVLFPRRL